jgi:hypothetical protein
MKRKEREKDFSLEIVIGRTLKATHLFCLGVFFSSKQMANESFLALSLCPSPPLFTPAQTESSITENN